MTSWQVAHVGAVNDDVEIDRHNVWRHTWRQSPLRRVRLPSPQYPEHQTTFHIYEIGDNARPVTFAAAEMSNGIFAFYRRAGD
jgi:hypothetical protein